MYNGVAQNSFPPGMRENRNAFFQSSLDDYREDFTISTCQTPFRSLSKTSISLRCFNKKTPYLQAFFAFGVVSYRNMVIFVIISRGNDNHSRARFLCIPCRPARISIFHAPGLSRSTICFVPNPHNRCPKRAYIFACMTAFFRG